MTTTEQFLQMTFQSSKIVPDEHGTLYRFETRIDDLTGLKLTRKFPLPALVSATTTRLPAQ